jgi:two-component system catabolic regulation response regulator CreB
MPRVLIVEDEVAIAETLLYALRGEGFEATWTRLGGEAVSLLREEQIDLVILDVGLPDVTGFEACKAIRQFSDVPVIFLTARAGEIDRVVGLEIGADDYVVKPFSPREVVARVRVILKRSGATASTAAAGVGGGFQVDSGRARISFLGQPLRLTPHEFRLMQAMLARPEHVFSREQLLAVLGQPAEAGYERNIDGHIKSLRAKLREISPEQEPIQTHRGFGYSYQPGKAY